MKNKRLWVSIVAGFLATVLLLGLILSGIPVKAASSSELQNQIEEMKEQWERREQEIEALQSQQESNTTEIRALMDQKNLLDQQVSLLYAQIDNLNQQLAAYNVLIADKQAELDEAQLRLETLTQQNRVRIRAMEENGELTYWSVLAQANSFFELLDRLVMVQELAEADSQRLLELKSAAADVEAARETLLAEQAYLKDVKAELLDTEEVLNGKRLQAQELLIQLLAKGAEYTALLEEMEKEQDALLEEQAKKEAEYDEAKYAEYMATATRPTQAEDGNGGSAVVDPSGMTWVVPCSYTQVSSPFGMRYHPLDGAYRHHNGVDLWEPDIYGKPIYATRNGYVSLAGWYGSGGNTVMLQHEAGYKSIYMHMSRFAVSEGDYVTAGQIIGYIGDSGGTTGPHLHFEIRIDGTPVNPMDYIG